MSKCSKCFSGGIGASAMKPCICEEPPKPPTPPQCREIYDPPSSAVLFWFIAVAFAIFSVAAVISAFIEASS